MIHLVLSFHRVSMYHPQLGVTYQLFCFVQEASVLHIEIAKHVYETFTKHGPYKFFYRIGADWLMKQYT